jgi:hypothetical protein
MGGVVRILENLGRVEFIRLGIVAMQAGFVGRFDDVWHGFVVPVPDQGHVDEVTENVVDQRTVTPDVSSVWGEIGVTR